MEALKIAAKRVLDYKDDPRQCVRYGTTLAHMVIAHFAAGAVVSSEKSATEPKKEVEAVDLEAPEPKKSKKSKFYRTNS